ncbi:MAG: hypothetical protein U0794_14590 [Isosphaeraceae bacterium]
MPDGSEHGFGDLAGTDTATHETISLLLDEISRLEAELRAREESLLNDASWQEPAPAAPEVDALKATIEELNAEIARRDESIDLLLEETRLFEEAAAAQRAELEQVTRWVEEVEQRIAERDSSTPELAGQLDAERRANEELRHRIDTDRRAWESQKNRLEQELQALRARPVFDEQESPALRALEHEYDRLREAYVELEAAASAAVEIEPLRERLAVVQDENEALRNQLRQEKEARARERGEFDVALAMANAQTTRAAQQRAVEVEEPAAPARDPSLDPDERIRAFRQHLQELHQREAEERAKRGLTARISRIWRHTSS